MIFFNDGFGIIIDIFVELEINLSLELIKLRDI